MKKIIIYLIILSVLLASFGGLSAQCSDTLTIVSPDNDVSENTAIFQGYETIIASNTLTNNADASIYAPNIILQNGMYVASGSKLLAKPIEAGCEPTWSPCDPVIDLGGSTLLTGTVHAKDELISTGTIPLEANVSLKAGQCIELQNGFSVEAGAEFSGGIEDCFLESNLSGGEMHNQVMDSVYQTLIFAVENNLTEEEILNITYQTTINTLAELSGNSPSAIESTLTTIGFPNYFPSFEEDSTLIEDLYAATMAELDDLQLKSDLENLVLMIGESANHQEFNDYLFNLRQAYQGTTNEEFITGVADIATHSYQYWENNIDNWIPDNTLPGLSDEEVDRIIEADVKGAMAAVITGVGIIPAATTSSAVEAVWIYMGW